MNGYSNTTNTEIEEHTLRLQRTEERIVGLVQFIADGDHSPAVRNALKDLEAQAKLEKEGISMFRRRASKPIRLPSIDELTDRALDIEAMVAADPTRAREELVKFFEGGRIIVKPQPGRFYVAEAKLFPLMILSNKPKAGTDVSGLCATAVCCAGRI